MYCIGCGADNFEGSLRCVRCGHDLATLRTDEYTKPKIDSSSPILWNPDAAAILSILFSPIFGAIICALNWRRLGQPRRALVSWLWAVFIFLFLVIVGIGAAHSVGGAGQFDRYNIYSRFTHWGILPIWYFIAAREQGKYIMQQLHGQYFRESWFIPVVAAILLIGSIYGLMEILW